MLEINLDKKEKYILGCSFGPDSMALFHLLYNNGYNFVVCNIDYNYRPESKWETDSIEKICKEKNVPFYTKNVLFSTNFHNFEAWARKIRYDFFKEIGKSLGIYNILIAHQKDELLETYLFQKERNSIVSFYGLADEYVEDNFKIIRPLLSYSKKDILDFLDQNGYEYSIDPTNFDTKLTRNHFRHEVLKEMSEKEKESLIIEINEKNNINDLENNEINCFLSDYISLEFIRNRDIKFLQKLIIRMLERNKISRTVSFDTAKALYIAVQQNKEWTFDIANNISIYFDTKTLSYIDKTIDYELPITNEIIKVNFNLLEGENPENFVIKPAKLGSNYKISNYFVKINRLFIDWKMPHFIRNFYPAIFDETGNIVYLPRYREKYIKKNNSIMDFDLNNFYNYLRNMM